MPTTIELNKDNNINKKRQHVLKDIYLIEVLINILVKLIPVNENDQQKMINENSFKELDKNELLE